MPDLALQPGANPQARPRAQQALMCEMRGSVPSLAHMARKIQPNSLGAGTVQHKTAWKSCQCRMLV